MRSTMRISAASATPGGRNVRARRKREGRVDARGARRRAVCVMVCISCTAGVQRFIRHPPRGGDGGAGHLRRRFVGAFCRRSSPRNSHPRVVGECYRDKERIMTRRTVPRAPRRFSTGFFVWPWYNLAWRSPARRSDVFRREASPARLRPSFESPLTRWVLVQEHARARIMIVQGRYSRSPRCAERATANKAARGGTQWLYMPESTMSSTAPS